MIGKVYDREDEMYMNVGTLEYGNYSPTAGIRKKFSRFCNFCNKLMNQNV